MATTTNYGWTTPDDTALVKDGASAIRTLGSSIDTTTKNLNPSTTLGDIEYRSSTANTNTRLPIGTTGQVLTVSGGVPAWATPGATGALTKIASGSFTSAATTNVDSVFSTTYTKYFVIVEWVISTGLANLQWRFRYGGATENGANYYGSGFRQDRANTKTDFGYTGATAATVDISAGTATKSLASMYFANVGNSSQKAYGFSSGFSWDNQGLFMSTQYVDVARIYDGFELTADSGNLTGTYAVYGVQN